MTVPLHTFNFYSARKSTSGAVGVYTVPTGFRAVIKAISINNADTVSRNGGVLIDGAWWILNGTMTAFGTSGSHLAFSGFIVLHAGKVIDAYNGVASPLDFNISGYLYPVTL